MIHYSQRMMIMILILINLLMMVRNTNPNHLDNYHVIQRVSNPVYFILGIEQPWIQTPVKQCECGSCGLLDSEEGSVCCKQIRSSSRANGWHWLFFKYDNITTSGLKCICMNPDVESLIKPEVIKVQLLVMWDVVGANSEISNRLGF